MCTEKLVNLIIVKRFRAKCHVIASTRIGTYMPFCGEMPGRTIGENREIGGERLRSGRLRLGGDC